MIRFYLVAKRLNRPPALQAEQAAPTTLPRPQPVKNINPLYPQGHLRKYIIGGCIILTVLGVSTWLGVFCFNHNRRFRIGVKSISGWICTTCKHVWYNGCYPTRRVGLVDADCELESFGDHMDGAADRAPNSSRQSTVSQGIVAGGA